MLKIIKIIQPIILIIFISMTLTGCWSGEAQNRLRWLDDRAGEMLDDLPTEQEKGENVATSSDVFDPSPLVSTSTISRKTIIKGALSIWNFIKKISALLKVVQDTGEKNKEPDIQEKDATKSETTAGELTQGLKEKIDKWLKENNFNRYGDPEETYYIGGTPLLNEATGELIERFNYILEKHPDIFNKL